MPDATKYDGLNTVTRSPEQVYLRDIALALSCRYASKQIDPTLDTSAYADGDVFFVPVEISDVVINAGESVLLDAVKVIDKDDKASPIDLIFLKSDVSIGDLNDTATVPTTAEYLGTVKLVAADYTDLGAIRVGEKKEVNEIFATADDSTSIWVGGIIRGAATYGAATDMSVILSFKRS